MDIAEMTWLIAIESEQRTELERLISSAADEKDFVTSWIVKPGASVVLCTGLDDDNRHCYVCLIPRLDGEDLCNIYVSCDALSKRYPKVRTISSYLPTGATVSADLDDDAIDQRYEELGLTFNDDLMEKVGPFPAAFEFTLSYALDNIGDCEIRLLEKDDPLYENEFEDQSLLEKTIGSCALSYGNPETREGFGEFCYFILE